MTSTITPASPVTIEGTVSSAVSSDVSSIRAEAEKAASAVRKDLTAVSSVVSADVTKVETSFGKVKAFIVANRLPLLIGWALGWVAGYFGPHL